MSSYFQDIELKDCVVFIEGNTNASLVNFVSYNLKTIQKRFIEKNKRFIILSSLEKGFKGLDVIKYRYPYLNKLGIENDIILNSLSLTKVKGNTLAYYEGNQLIYLTLSDKNNFNDQIDALLSSFNFDEIDYLPASISDYKDDNIKLDADTEKKLEILLNELEAIKSSGQLLQVLPIIEKYLSENGTVSKELSTLKVDINYNLLLVDYNIEIKLSHLTKSIYLLFLNNPKGVKLNELENYADELLGYYKVISNRDDYDKMRGSISDIINTKSNAIYVHLSRIKSAFINVIHPDIAKNYYVDGGKMQPKKILLDRALVVSTHLNYSDEIDF